MCELYAILKPGTVKLWGDEGCGGGDRGAIQSLINKCEGAHAKMVIATGRLFLIQLTNL